MFPGKRRFSLLRLFLLSTLSLTLLPPLIVSVILIIIDRRRKRHRPQGYFVSLRDQAPLMVGGEQNTEVQLYTYGEDLFTDMLRSIGQAQERICLETFIWKNDYLGQQLKDALIEAATRGVEVFVIYDAFANLVVPPSFQRFASSTHVLRYSFLPALKHPFRLKSYARDHRKLLIIDGQTAFIGGYNLGEIYAKEWRDTHARIVGVGALEVENTFIDFWNAHKKLSQPFLPDRPQRSWDFHLHIRRNDPPMMIYPIRMTYLEAIDRATQHIYLTNAYFLPDRILLRALLSAARRGVDVRILVPAVSNHIVVDWLSHDYYEECLRAGIHLLLYEGAMLHAKTATIDGVWSTVGTANLDRLSMVGNFEVNVEIFDAGVARQMERIFLRDATYARKLDLEQWRKRPWHWKISEKALHQLRPFL
ncbi:MAG TPA: phospholipase D-like domain-containing protein [Ktedonobacteraceae bacterium]|nr:phospholipase D-like domain-containing protein [Ktedonobacteraceae bacterium]